ncbi:hypothetical protein [Haloferula sp. BvORR071]|uniref:hypothetical protein n=1 Tax=Haloferula sp. BvORR071 TaxID=1396141 RepID=UPI002240EA49|nr:hypothetical protein [Haloferula sp. BvORR071]
MNRRHWLLLAGSALSGCRDEHKPAPAPTQTSEADPLKAGPFSVTLPPEWKATAIIEKVPLRPLYTEDEWQAFQKDQSLVLKPSWGCRPEHWAIRLPAALPKGIDFNTKDPGDDPTAPQILIHRLDQWDDAFTNGKPQEGKLAFTSGHLRERMDGILNGQAPRPCPAFMDASLSYRCLPQRIDFNGGHGVRMIAEWEIETDLMTKGDLHYLFLGMSDDNSCQIIATFPIDLPGLPERGEKAEHLGRSLARYEELEKGYDAYVTDAEAWLKQHQAEITPKLDTLDAMLRSLVAKSWA